MGFTEKQQEYFFNATHRWNVKSGATRSGKTYMDYFVIPKRIRSLSGKDGLIILLGNTKGTLQRNIIEPLQGLWGVKYVSDIKSDNTAYMFGEKVYCLGADKINQVDRLRGSSIKYCYGDEVVTWHEDVFNMLKSRLDKEYSKFDGTCNPDNPNHWFKKFIDSAEEKGIDLYYQKYRLDDNTFLPETVKENIKREHAGSVFYDRYVLGEWTLAEGLVYPMFKKSKHCFDKLPKGYYEWYVSVDYGTQNPCVMQLWAVDIYRRAAYLTKEYYYDGRKKMKQKTDSDYYKDLFTFCKGTQITNIIIDPSAASFKAEIRSHGYFSCRDANNAVVDGIRYTASCIQTEKIFIHKDCENTISEFNAYSWDDKSTEDKVIKENDHAMDALRYMAYTVLRNIGF